MFFKFPFISLSFLSSELDSLNVLNKLQKIQTVYSINNNKM